MTSGACDMGTRIRAYGQRKGLTQKELATRVMISHQQISLYELGKSVPTADTIVPLGEALGAATDVLVGYDPAEDGAFAERDDDEVAFLRRVDGLALGPYGEHVGQAASGRWYAGGNWQVATGPRAALQRAQSPQSRLACSPHAPGRISRTTVAGSPVASGASLVPHRGQMGVRSSARDVAGRSVRSRPHRGHAMRVLTWSLLVGNDSGLRKRATYLRVSPRASGQKPPSSSSPHRKNGPGIMRPFMVLFGPWPSAMALSFATSSTGPSKGHATSMEPPTRRWHAERVLSTCSSSAGLPGSATTTRSFSFHSSTPGMRRGRDPSSHSTSRSPSAPTRSTVPNVPAAGASSSSIPASSTLLHSMRPSLSLGMRARTSVCRALTAVALIVLEPSLSWLACGTGLA